MPNEGSNGAGANERDYAFALTETRMSFFTSASIVNVRLQWKVVVQPGPKYGAGQQLPGAPAYEGRQDVTRIIGNMVLVKSGPHKRNNFWEKLSAI